MPPSYDKTAATPAFTLISLAGTRLRFTSCTSSLSSSMVLKDTLQHSLPAFVTVKKRDLIGYRILRPTFFLRFRFVCMCVMSLRSLMQHLLQLEPSLVELIAALHTTPSSCLDQWVTCMSNSPLEHTHTHTRSLFSKSTPPGMCFHVLLHNTLTYT